MKVCDVPKRSWSNEKFRVVFLIYLFPLLLQAIPTTRSHVETSVSSSPSNSLNVWVGTSCGKYVQCFIYSQLVLRMHFVITHSFLLLLYILFLAG